MKQIVPDSEEFGHAEHCLRVQLDSPLLKIIQMEDITFKPYQSDFKNYTKNKHPSNIIDVFIPVNEIPFSKSFVASRGLKINTSKGSNLVQFLNSIQVTM